MARTIVGQHKFHNAKWSVMWVADGRIREKKLDDDLPEAVRLHALLVKAGRSGVTLRCTNVGFPAPRKYTQKEVVRTTIVRRGSKRYRKTTVRHVNMMDELNRRGIYWCPYCCKMRRFKLIKDRKRSHMQCPMCKVTSRDWHVRKENPQALVVEYHRKTRLRRSNTDGRKRRRRRRR